MHIPRTCSRLLVVALLLATPQGAGAQLLDDSPRIMTAERLSEGERIVLDGRLDEPVWQRAMPAEDFRQQEPGEGTPPTERTEVRIVYSAEVLYIGAMLFDSDPSGIKGYQKRRDAGLGSDDRFMWILDTFLDGRSAYFFEINPAGLMGDGLLRQSSGSNISKSWDGIWEARVSRHAQGWSAEIQIPFRTLNFNPASEEWGINFQRTIRRKNEELLWSGWRRTEGLFRPATAGRLRGLHELSQGVGLEVRPYGSATHRMAEGHGVGVGDVGADFGYSLTPSLRVALTVNTDFAETEVDDRQINLTRFPLFFPERRQFFLEGSSIYQFAGANGVTPFFSRRIGLASGEPVPIVYGARLGGQAGAYEVGALQLRTGTQGSTPAESFTVARAKRALFAQSSIGVIYTRRAADDGAAVVLPDGHTLGVDVDLYTSRFLQDKNLQFEAFSAWHTDPVRGGDSSARDRSVYGFRLNYPNDIWQAHVSYREFGEAFNPAVGFASRNGFRRLQPQVSWNPRPARWPAIRQFEFQTRLEYLTDLDGVLETRAIGATPLRIRFRSGDQFSVNVVNQYERLINPFRIADGIVLPSGEYSANGYSIDARTASQRPLSFNVGLNGGQFWSGTIVAWDFGVDVRPTPSVSLGTDMQLQSVDLPQGSFSTALTRVSASWYPTPWTSLTTRMQFDDVSDRLGLNVRLRWIVRPGSDFYFVYAHDWEETFERLVTRTRGATTKLNYTYRF
jgi:hypothetical protein